MLVVPDIGLNISSTVVLKVKFVTKNDMFLDKEFLAKEISGRTVTLEDIIESLVNVHRVVAPELLSISSLRPNRKVLNVMQEL